MAITQKLCSVSAPVLLLLIIVPTSADDTSSDSLIGNAETRIENHRKADASIVVVDQSGNAVADAQITVQQQRHSFLFGCNFFMFGKFRDPAEEAAYREQFSDLFNFATLPFYWWSYEREKDHPRHAETFAAAEWCKRHGIVTKGHPLAWNYMEPAWLPDDSAEVKKLQLARIKDCVTRFSGLIDIWDVVNEATHFERESLAKRAPKLTGMWQETGRLEFVDECFETAMSANPNATLLINDYRVDPAYKKLITALTSLPGKRRYSTIGIQSHMHGGTWTNEKLWQVCNQYQTFGVPLHFTELTILSGPTNSQRKNKRQPWTTTAEGEQRQAEEVRRVYTMLFSHPAVEAITWWDFCDRGAWQGAPAGFIGKDLKPKLAYRVLKDLVKNRWWTSEEISTNTQGQAKFRGFLGDYRVKVTDADGNTKETTFTVSRNSKNVTRISLK